MKLSIAGVECAYDQAPILRDVTLEIRSGDLAGVIGPNGSGKTTLLRTIAGILKPRVGAVLLDEESLVGMNARDLARRVATVPQRSPVPFDLTAWDIVLMGRTAHQDRWGGETERDFATVRDAMARVGCSHLASRPFATLSGGEQQRALIARALAQEPQILLLDEPTAHLDLAAQVQIMALVRQLCTEQRLIAVAVFHDLNLSARFADWLVLMNGGLVEAIGAIEDVLRPEALERAYGCRVRVARLPGFPHPIVIPMEGEA